MLNLSLVNAITKQEINEAKDLLDSKVSCDKLTNEQLEEIERNYRELRELRKQISPTPAETYRNKVEQKEEEEKEEKKKTKKYGERLVSFLSF